MRTVAQVEKDFENGATAEEAIERAVEDIRDAEQQLASKDKIIAELEEQAAEYRKIRDSQGQRLYVVYLGGQSAPGRMGEDHQVVAVVAPDIAAARKAAKAKWGGLGSAHVDAVQELIVVDGHDVLLRKGSSMSITPLDMTWVP